MVKIRIHGRRRRRARSCGALPARASWRRRRARRPCPPARRPTGPGATGAPGQARDRSARARRRTARPAPWSAASAASRRSGCTRAARGLRVADVQRRMGDDQVAAGGHRVHQRRDHRPRVLVVADQVQHAEQHDRDRLAEVERSPPPAAGWAPGRAGPPRCRLVAPSWVPRISACACRSTIGSLSTYTIRESGATRCATSCVLSTVGMPGPEVEELPDARLGREVAHRPAEERPVRPHPVAQPRCHREHPVARDPVGGEVVLAAEPVVVDPRRVRDGGVDPEIGIPALVVRCFRHRARSARGELGRYRTRRS